MLCKFDQEYLQNFWRCRKLRKENYFLSDWFLLPICGLMRETFWNFLFKGRFFLLLLVDVLICGANEATFWNNRWRDWKLLGEGIKKLNFPGTFHKTTNRIWWAHISIFYGKLKVELWWIGSSPSSLKSNPNSFLSVSQFQMLSKCPPARSV